LPSLEWLWLSCFGWWRIPRPEGLWSWWWTWWGGSREGFARDSKPKCDRAVNLRENESN
jgi:hypothetical protein